MHVRLRRWIVFRKTIRLTEVVTNYVLVRDGVRPAFLAPLYEYNGVGGLVNQIDHAMHAGGLVRVDTDMGPFYVRADQRQAFGRLEKRINQGDDTATARALGYPVVGGMPHPLCPHRVGFEWLAVDRQSGEWTQMTACVTDDAERDIGKARVWARQMRQALDPHGFDVHFGTSPMPSFEGEQRAFYEQEYGPYQPPKPSRSVRPRRR